jgi:hypothetical protein
VIGCTSSSNPTFRRLWQQELTPNLIFTILGYFRCFCGWVACHTNSSCLKRARSTHVIHVSQLRCAVPPSTEVLQYLLVETAASPTPSQVLERRMYKHSCEMRMQVLMQWTDQPPSLATWEEQNKRRWFSTRGECNDPSYFLYYQASGRHLRTAHARSKGEEAQPTLHVSWHGSSSTPNYCSRQACQGVE